MGFFRGENMNQNSIHTVEKFKPKVMDLDLLSSTEMEHGTWNHL